MENRRGRKLGAYTLIRPLGEGGFAEVWLGRHAYLENLAAIKILKNETKQEAFLREAKIVASLNHPNIVQVRECNIERGIPFLVMEYAAKGSLRKNHPKGTQLTLTTIQNYVSQVTSALQYAHERKLIHRDIKPDNILMKDNGSIMLGDFGIVAIADNSQSQHTFSTPGTQAYMAPEQMLGHPQLASDQYALAATIYEWLTGKSPLEIHLYRTPEGKPPSLLAQVPTLPKAVEQVLFIALDTDPKQRFATIQAFALALEQAIASPPSTWSTPPTHKTQSNYGQPVAPSSSERATPLPSPSSPPISQSMPSAAPGASAPPPLPSMLSQAYIPPAPLTANALNDDADNLLPDPPVTPHQPQGGGIVSAALESAAPNNPLARPMGAELPSRMPDAQRSPTPLLPGQQTNTPRPAGSGKVPTVPPQSSQIHTGSGKQPAVQGAPGLQQPPNGRNGGSGKTPPVTPVPTGSPSISNGGAPSASRSATRPPTPYIQRSPSPRRRRILLLSALLLITLALIGGLAFSALGGVQGIASLGQLTATVTITPRSQIVQNNYLISGVTTTPDAAQRQVGARVLTTQSDTQRATGHATGSIAAKQAAGILTFQNTGTVGVTLGTSTLTGADGIQIKFFGPIFVPATGSASATATGYAVSGGAAGNIKAFDINGSCCTTNIFVKNATAFTGGQDAVPNIVIQQSDIDNAEAPLIKQLTTSTQAALQKQVKGNESVVDGTFQCIPTKTADQKVGDVAPTVTVSVSVACSEEVFDLAAAEQMAKGLLQTNLPRNIDLTGYALIGQIITSLVSATQVSAQGQVSINILAADRWVYQFTSILQQQIKQTLVKQSKSEVLNILKQYPGVSSVNIDISKGSTMPTDVNDITLNIAQLPGLQPGVPGSTVVPGGTGNTPTNGGTPGTQPTGTPILGGS